MMLFCCVNVTQKTSPDKRAVGIPAQIVACAQHSVATKRLAAKTSEINGS
jgi:hypothetical protein